MLRYCILLLIFLGSSELLLSQQNGTIVVTFENLKAELGGEVVVGLYTSQDGYLEKGKEYVGQIVAAAHLSEGRITFDDLPLGEYAVSMYHDSNGNGEMDTNFIGIPQEGYGFSNNVFGKLGPPKFKDNVISVSTGQVKEVSLKIKY